MLYRVDLFVFPAAAYLKSASSFRPAALAEWVSQLYRQPRTTKPCGGWKAVVEVAARRLDHADLRSAIVLAQDKAAIDAAVTFW